MTDVYITTERVAYDDNGIKVPVPECADTHKIVEGLIARAEEAEAELEKLLCSAEINSQIIANIVDTKPGNSIETQMIAAIKELGELEQKYEQLEKDALLLAVYIDDTDAGEPIWSTAQWEALERILALKDKDL